MDGSGRHRLSFLSRRLPPAFELWAAAVAPGRERPYHEAEWRDAIVVVERGAVEIEFLGGSRRRFARGDVLWLVGLPLRALHNRGREPALLVAVSRRRPGTLSAERESGGRHGDDNELFDRGEVVGVAGVDREVIRDRGGGDHRVVGAGGRRAPGAS